MELIKKTFKNPSRMLSCSHFCAGLSRQRWHSSRSPPGHTAASGHYITTRGLFILRGSKGGKKYIGFGTNLRTSLTSLEGPVCTWGLGSRREPYLWRLLCSAGAGIGLDCLGAHPPHLAWCLDYDGHSVRIWPVNEPKELSHKYGLSRDAEFKYLEELIDWRARKQNQKQLWICQ